MFSVVAIGLSPGDSYSMVHWKYQEEEPLPKPYPCQEQFDQTRKEEPLSLDHGINPGYDGMKKLECLLV